MSSRCIFGCSPQENTHFPCAESLRLRNQVVDDAGCVLQNPIEVEVASSTWGRLIYEESIPYVGEIYCASDCIEEIMPQFHLPIPESIVQPLYGTVELEDSSNGSSRWVSEPVAGTLY